MIYMTSMRVYSLYQDFQGLLMLCHGPRLAVGYNFNDNFETQNLTYLISS